MDLFYFHGALEPNVAQRVQRSDCSGPPPLAQCISPTYSHPGNQSFRYGVGEILTSISPLWAVQLYPPCRVAYAILELWFRQVLRPFVQGATIAPSLQWGTYRPTSPVAC